MTPSTLQTDFKPRILAQLDEVADLPRGWDGADAPPPRADILAAVRQWADRLPERAAFGPVGPALQPGLPRAEVLGQHRFHRGPRRDVAALRCRLRAGRVPLRRRLGPRPGHAW